MTPPTETPAINAIDAPLVLSFGFERSPVGGADVELDHVCTETIEATADVEARDVCAMVLDVTEVEDNVDVVVDVGYISLG